MKTYLYLSTAIVGVMIGGNTWAQCVSTQDCATLGYTESSCSGDDGGVKCPFGNKWACYYTPEPYNSVECTVGTLYYSDGKCYDEYIDSKTLLGVVIYEKSASESGWIMTVNPIQSSIMWSTEYVNVPGITSTTSWSTAAKDFDSCGNTDKIRAQGNSSTYPAAWAAYNYQPSGTPTGKRWCLPAAGVINSLYNNLSTINTAISKAGGTKLVNDNEHIWSSSEYSSNHAWIFCTKGTGGLGSYLKNYYTGSTNVVRPVLAF